MLHICSLALLGLLLGMPIAEAQVVTVKRVAQSPASLGITSSSPTWQVYSGLRVIGKGMKAYFAADTTGSGANKVTSYQWAITAKPSGSNATIDTADKATMKFMADVTGQYIVTCTVNGGKSSADTIFASTFQGVGGTAVNCGMCHPSNNTDWQKTAHASIYKEGITGKLEVNAYGQGTYGVNCIRCHTTGWEPNADNNNFGSLSKKTGWDTMWYKPAALSGTSVLINNGDTSRWAALTTNSKYAGMSIMATIGCESCHGAGADHMGNKAKIGKSLDGGVCNVCHNAPSKHILGGWWLASNHASMPLSSAEAGNASCYPCHSGAAFVKFANNRQSPGYSAATDNFPSISCATCHDPHSTKNENQLRIVSLDSLVNGYKPPAGIGGKGLLCMNCHHGRSNAEAKVASQAVKFADRFYNHYSPQADMFFGANGIEYGLNLTGLSSHSGIKDACVTCHMATRVEGSASLSNHQMGMVNSSGADIVTACTSCHGNITKFDDVKASSDYDGNGKIEGVQTEVQGLLDKLKAQLPKDATGEVVTMAKDSAAVKSHPRYPTVLSAMWNYWYVKNDFSLGIHNPKYTVAILQASLRALDQTIPVELTTFTASVKNDVVTVKWETATETNNRGFEIQRNVTGTWQTVGFVEGKGTSAQIHKYQFADKVQLPQSVRKAVYRLNQLDLDGSSHFSKEVTVALTINPYEFKLAQNYPNPFNPTTIITYNIPTDCKVKISVYNPAGQLIKELVNEVKESGTYDIRFEGSRLASGIYFYTIEANALNGTGFYKNTRKMILVK
jgi:hypothetical protein